MQERKIVDLHQDYDSMRKFFLFAAKKTEDKEKKKKYEMSAKICESMKEICSLLLQASEDILRKEKVPKR